MRTTLFVVACAVLIVGGFVGSARAALINVEIGRPGQVAYTGPAAVGAAGDQWNLLTGYTTSTPQTVSNLKDSTGATTPASFTMGDQAGAGGPVQAAGTVANVLIDNFADALTGNGDPTYTGTFSGLTPGGAYALYLIGNRGGGGYGATFGVSIGTTTGDLQRTTGNGFDGTFTPGRDYVAYSGSKFVTANSSGVIQFTVANDTVTNHNILNGAQLVAVPEPGSLGLLGLGIGVYLARRGRRCA
jgi:hypothetical protein